MEFAIFWHKAASWRKIKENRPHLKFNSTTRMCNVKKCIQSYCEGGTTKEIFRIPAITATNAQQIQEPEIL